MSALVDKAKYQFSNKSYLFWFMKAMEDVESKDWGGRSATKSDSEEDLLCFIDSN
jgi:hypothetical protein